jgi:hypothetical protein
VVAEAATQPGGVFLAGNGIDEVRVDAQHDRLAEVTAGHPGWRDPPVPGGDQRPDPLPHAGPGRLDAVEGRLVEFTQRAAQRGRRRDRAVQVPSVTQDIDGAYRVAAAGHHDGGVDRDPAAVVVRGGVPAAQGIGQGPGQTGAVGR